VAPATVATQGQALAPLSTLTATSPLPQGSAPGRAAGWLRPVRTGRR